MGIKTGPFRMANDESPKLAGKLDLNGNFITDSSNEVVFEPQGASNWDIIVADSTGDDEGSELVVSAGHAGSATVGNNGGNITLEAGSAGGSGNNDGGEVILLPGENTASGAPGSVSIVQPGSASPQLDSLSIWHSPNSAQISVANQDSSNDSSGIPLLISAGSAGSSTTGGGGGDIRIAAGDADGSGDNDGGNISFTPGSSANGGEGGVFMINQPGGTPGTDTIALLHDGTDVIFGNLDSTGGFVFMDDTFSEVFFFDDKEVSYSGFLKRTVEPGITASTTQSQGQQPITAETNLITTVANPNDVVTLPSVSAGVEVFLMNAGANTLQIFPASGDDLGAGVDTSTTLTAGSQARYIGLDNDKWIPLTI